MRSKRYPSANIKQDDKKSARHAAFAAPAQYPALESALLEISESIHTTKDMQAFYGELHRIVGTLVYAENFCVVARLPGSHRLRCEYMCDQSLVNNNSSSVLNGRSQAELEGSLIAHVINSDQLLHLDRAAAERIVTSVNLVMLGEYANDWLGIPLRSKSGTFGAIVVQSYQDGISYSEQDSRLLEVLCQHMAIAMERKWADESLRQALDGLEARIKRRTTELSTTHGKLKREILERKRSEKIQATLYKIAQLATEQIDLRSFCRAVHHAIGELVYAKNLFLALVDEQAGMLRYPYIADEVHDTWLDDPLPASMSEQCGPTLSVLITGEARLYGRAGLPFPQNTWGKIPVAWLGVPLSTEQGTIGVLAIQSYDAGYGFDNKDTALLTFIARQVALSIQRREDKEALRRANGELVARVGKRTKALHSAHQHLTQTSVELHSIQKQLMESERLMIMGALMAGIVYEINTPIAHAHKVSTDLRLQANLDPNVQSALTTLHTQLEQATQLIESFRRAASDQDTWQPRKFDLRRELEAIVTVLGSSIEDQGHRIQLNCPAAVEVEGYPAILYQIVSNLISNSMKHGFTADQKGAIEINVEVLDDGFVLRYRDSGRGMALKAQERIFEPFFIGGNERGGTGLGMHAVYNYITRIGGTITVSECPVGEGVVFEIWLPKHCDIRHRTSRH